jgi:transposase
VYAWRRDFRLRLETEGVALPAAEPDAATFVPAVLEPSAMPASIPVRRTRKRRRSKASAIELEIDGVAVKIGHGADAGVITAVIEALRARR